MQERAPILYNFLAWEIDQSRQRMSRGAQDLLELLVSLAKAAYQPASLAQYKGCVNRANKEIAPTSGKLCKLPESLPDVVTTAS